MKWYEAMKQLKRNDKSDAHGPGIQGLRAWAPKPCHCDFCLGFASASDGTCRAVPGGHAETCWLPRCETVVSKFFGGLITEPAKYQMPKVWPESEWSEISFVNRASKDCCSTCLQDLQRNWWAPQATCHDYSCECLLRSRQRVCKICLFAFKPQFNS